MAQLGFEPHHTGGNCMAYRRPLEDGGKLLITAGEGWLPESMDEPVLVCRYGPEGEPVDDNGIEYPDLHAAMQALSRFEPIPKYEGEVTEETAAAWLGKVVGRLGAGFHLDTPAREYEPPLPGFEVRNLDAPACSGCSRNSMQTPMRSRSRP
jgi:hypothetical protein